MAREAIEALDEVRSKREQWVVAARTMKDGPIIQVGPWTTKNQAMRAVNKIAFADSPSDTPGCGALVIRMRTPEWLDSL